MLGDPVVIARQKVGFWQGPPAVRLNEGLCDAEVNIIRWLPVHGDLSLRVSVAAHLRMTVGSD